MTKAYITEFSFVPNLQGFQQGPASGPVELAAIAGSTDQTPVDFSAGAASSAAFAVGTKYIRVSVDSICSYKNQSVLVVNGVATWPTAVATTSSARMPADNVEYFWVNPGDKISFITNT